MAIIAKYSLNGNLNDLTGNGSGTLTGGGYTTGGINGDLLLSGSGQYATCSNVNSYIAGNNKLTIEALVYPTSTAYKMISVNRQQSGSYYLDFQLAKDGAGKIVFETYGQNNTSGVAVTGTSVIPQNKWSYVVGTYDGSLLKVYLNGLYQGQATQNANFGTTTGASLMIGRNTPVSSGQDWSGKIDEFIVRNNKLSDGDIKNRYLFLKGFI